MKVTVSSKYTITSRQDFHTQKHDLNTTQLQNTSYAISIISSKMTNSTSQPQIRTVHPSKCAAANQILKLHLFYYVFKK